MVWLAWLAICWEACPQGRFRFQEARQHSVKVEDTEEYVYYHAVPCLSNVWTRRDGQEAGPGPCRGLLGLKTMRRTSRWRGKGPWVGSESHSVGYSWDGYLTFLHGIWKSVFMVSFRLADDIKIMWVRGSPGASVVGGWLGLIPGQGTRSHMSQLNILCASTKTWHSQIKKIIINI